MQYRTCYRCPLKPGCLYLHRVRDAVVHAPVTFTSVAFKCEYKKGHLVAGARVLVELPGMVEAGPVDPLPFRFSAVVMRWKGRKVQVWLIKPDCSWPPYLQAKGQVVSVWPDQVRGIDSKQVLAAICPDCRKPVDQPVTRGTWQCRCTDGGLIE